MSFPYSAALSSTLTDKLRGIGAGAPRGWAADQYVCVTPNVTIFAARVNGAISGSTPFAELTYDTVTTGAYTDIKPGMVLIVSPTNNRRDPAAIRLRMRQNGSGDTATATELFFNEISSDIGDNYYIFVIDTRDLTDRLARPLSLTTQAKDYDLTFERLAPVVVGLNSVYVGFIDSVTNKFRIALDISNSFAGDVDSTTSFTYQWIFKPGTETVISGSLTAAAVTVDITEGHQWAEVLITDSQGISWTREFEIHACGNTYTPLQGFSGAQINCEVGQGYSCSIRGFAGLDSVLDGTRIVVWRAYEYYNAKSVANEGELIAGYNIDFVGYIERETMRGESSADYSFESDVTFEIAGVGQIFSRLEAQILALRNDFTPTAWDEIDNLTVPYRAIVHFLQRHTTFLNLFDLSFSATVQNSSYLFPFASTQGGNILSMIEGISGQINAVPEFAPDGALRVVRDARYLNALDRAGVNNIINFDNRDLFGLEETREHWLRVGKTDGDGAVYNSSADQVTAMRSRAPGHAQGYGADSSSLNNQILTVTANPAEAQAELNQRTGQAHIIANDEGNELTVRMPDGYHFLVPSVGMTYTWTLDGSENVRGIVYTTDTKWLLYSISHSHDNVTGAREVSSLRFKRLLPIADPGDTVPMIGDDGLGISIPDLPLFGFDFELPEFAFPLIGLPLSQIDPKLLKAPKGKAAKVDGSTMLVKSTDGTKAFLLTNVIALSTPQAYDVTPPDLGAFLIKAVLFDPFNKADQTGNKYAYILVSDGTDSKVYRTEDIFAKPPEWTAGDAVDGVYTILRGTAVDGGIEIYTPGTPSTPVSYDFTTGAHGWTAYDSGTQIFGTLVGGSGWEDTYPAGANDGIYLISPVITGATVISEVTVHTNPNWTGVNPQMVVKDAAQTATYMVSTDSGSNAIVLSGYAPVDQITVIADPFIGSSEHFNGYITGIDIIYVTTQASTRYSDDRGETWQAADVVGDTPGASSGGFDTQKAGGVQYASAHNEVKIATSLGGAFGAAAGGTFTSDPRTVIQPYFVWGSVTSKNTTTATPDYLVITSASGSSVKRITGAGTVVDITPVAGFTGYSEDGATSLYGTHLAVLGTVAGAQRVYSTINAGNATPTWILVASVSGCNWIRSRRGDTRAKNGGQKGQLFIIAGSTLYYSYDWGDNVAPRTLPMACDSGDVLG